jgi:hypothetical protein
LATIKSTGVRPGVDRHPSIGDVRLDWAEQLVLGEIARLPIAYADDAADAGRSIGRGNNDLRHC